MTRPINLFTATLLDLRTAFFALPRMRQCLINVPPAFGRPIWVDDHDFRIDRHCPQLLSDPIRHHHRKPEPMTPLSGRRSRLSAALAGLAAVACLACCALALLLAAGALSVPAGRSLADGCQQLRAW